MRPLKIMALPALLLALAGTQATMKPQESIAGTWIPVAQEFNGQQLPAAAFRNQRLTLTDTSYVMQAESTDKGSVQVQGNKLDIRGVEGVNKGKRFNAIFKREQGRLVICYNLAGNGYPAAFETAGHPLYFMASFEKEPHD